MAAQGSVDETHRQRVRHRRGAGGRNEDFITDTFTLGQNQLEVVVAPTPMSVPTNVVRPTITGSSLVSGQVLTALEETWTNGPTSYTYQWQRDVAGNGTFSNIVGAPNKTYTLVGADVSNAVRVQVTAINAAGSSAVANSLPVGLVH